MSKPLLHIIIGSTRPGRVGSAIARWFIELAIADGRFDVDLVDLAEVDLPLFNEPHEPAERDYQFEHTKQWSARVSKADAFVFVIPEYNHSFNAATKNALDYLYHEWRYKAVGLVSYGGGAKGTRAIQHLKPVLTALTMSYAGELSVALADNPIVEGVFRGNERFELLAAKMLKELSLLTRGLMERRRTE